MGTSAFVTTSRATAHNPGPTSLLTIYNKRSACTAAFGPAFPRVRIGVRLQSPGCVLKRSVSIRPLGCSGFLNSFFHAWASLDRLARNSSNDPLLVILQKKV